MNPTLYNRLRQASWSGERSWTHPLRHWQTTQGQQEASQDLIKELSAVTELGPEAIVLCRPVATIATVATVDTVATVPSPATPTPTPTLIPTPTPASTSSSRDTWLVLLVWMVLGVADGVVAAVELARSARAA